VFLYLNPDCPNVMCALNRKDENQEGNQDENEKERGHFLLNPADTCSWIVVD